MNSDPEGRGQPDFPGVDRLREEFRGELLRAGRLDPDARSRPLMRRLIAPLAVLAAVALPTGMAVADRLTDDDSANNSANGRVSLEPGTTVGYIDRSTGEEVRCADGELLTTVIELKRQDAVRDREGGRFWAVPPDGVDADLPTDAVTPVQVTVPDVFEATCADGSVPAEYERGRIAVFEVD